MIRSTAKLTGIVGIISALLFAGAFALYTSRQTEESGAASVLGCEAGQQVRIFFSDIAAYSNYNHRTIYDTSFDPSQRTFTLDDQVISPGKYEVLTISSDSHYGHRSNAPDEDLQNQQNEEYYITIDGQRTAQHSTDFTDFYDWRGADGELLQDDDDSVDTIPTVIRNTWQGESLGTIDVGQATNQILVQHASIFDGFTPHTNSVIPAAVVMNCLEQRTPLLEIQKLVDGDRNGEFDDDQEQAKDGELIQWKIVGRNIGDGSDPAAVIEACAPVGTTFIENSPALSSDTSFGTLTETSNCFSWNGALEPGERVEITFDVRADDIDACDEADGAKDGLCYCDAKIYSAETGTNAENPADSDVAAVNQLEPSLSIIKKVDGSDDNDTFSDISEQIIPDGRTVAWEITAKNDGPGDLDNARIVDTYPDGVSVSAVEASVGSATVDGADVTWNGSLASGQSVILTVNSSIDNVSAFNACEQDQGPGNTNGDNVCVNRAFVGEATPGDPTAIDSSEIYDDAEVYAVLTPSLQIKKFVDGVDSDAVFSDQDAELIEAGTNFTWRVRGCNVGDVVESTARIVDVMPAGVTLLDTAADVRVDGVAGSANVSIVSDPETGRDAVVWNGPLEVGADNCVQIEYTTVISDQPSFAACEAASDGLSDTCGVSAYIGTAAGDGLGVDPLTRDSDPAYVRAEFASVLTIQKLIDGDDNDQFDDVVEQTDLNQTFSWKIIAANTGNTTEANARVVDILPANMELVSTNSSDVAVTLSSGASTESINIVNDSGVTAIVWDGQLAVDASVEIVFQAQLTTEDMLNACVVETEGDYCRNVAEVGRADVLSPTGVVGQTAFDPADVYAQPTGELSIVKEVDVDTDSSWSDLERIELDEWFEWRITVSNQGDGTVNDAAMLDVFPEGVLVDEITQISGDGTVDLVAGADKYQAFWTTASFAPGATAEFIARAKIVDIAAFDACDTGTVDGDTDELCTNRAFVGTGTTAEDFSDTANDDAQVDVLRVAELYLSKLAEGSDSDSDFTDFEEVAVNGEEFEWEVTFGNSGTGVADDVEVFDPLPVGATYVTHRLNGSGLADFDEAARRVTWSGDLNPGEQASITITAFFESANQFISCDGSDGSEDSQCVNTARLTYDDVELEDPAVVLNTNLKPVIELSKVVDGNADNSFSEIEEVDSDGAVVTWRVTVSNTGNGPARGIVVSDDVEEGLQYMPDSVVEVEGAEYGDLQYVDGVVEWSGSLDAGQSATMQFQTTVVSAAEFTKCNFSDGDSGDGQCTNNAVVTLGDSDTPIDEDSANITTSLPTVLAYTGTSQGVSSVVVGGAIAFAAMVLLFGAYATRSKDDNGGGSGGGGDSSMTRHLPKIVIPQ